MDINNYIMIALLEKNVSKGLCVYCIYVDKVSHIMTLYPLLRQDFMLLRMTVAVKIDFN